LFQQNVFFGFIVLIVSQLNSLSLTVPPHVTFVDARRWRPGQQRRNIVKCRNFDDELSDRVQLRKYGWYWFSSFFCWLCITVVML